MANFFLSQLMPLMGFGVLVQSLIPFQKNIPPPCFVVALLLLNIANVFAQAKAPATNLALDRVIIKPRKIVLVRSPALVKEFPHRKTAVVTYPIVSGLSNPAVLNKVRSALALSNIFGSTLNDYRSDTWLSEFGYVVNYNRNLLLDITFTQSGVGAYPDEHTKHLLINLRDGSIVRARDAFVADKLGELARLVDVKLQAELNKIDRENAGPGEQGEENSAIKETHENLKFEVENLDEFSVSAKGITFLFDAGFPHAIKAFEPKGRYFFTYTELKNLIRPDGLLAPIAR